MILSNPSITSISLSVTSSVFVDGFDELRTWVISWRSRFAKSWVGFPIIHANNLVMFEKGNV